MSDKAELLSINDSLDERFRGINLIVLEDDRFNTWAGATRNHHVYKGGLLHHTLEVVRFCDFTASQNININRNILITAAIWHDFGKVWDFAPTNDYYNNWIATEHKEKVYHVVRSYAEFIRTVETHFPLNINKSESLEIQHCILSHHNLPEWNSPRKPQSREAWALHLADMNSAFCCDDRAEIKT